MLHFGRAGLFQVFVMIEMEFDLFDQLRRQIGQCFDFIARIAVVRRHHHHFVIHLAVIDKLHNANNARLHINTGRQRIFGDNQSIQLIAVLVQCLRNETVIGGFCENLRLNAVQLHHRQFSVPFDFVRAAFGNFHHHVDNARVHIAHIQNLIKICHFDS